MPEYTAGPPWGASADDWTSLNARGLGADLLPTVCEPGAKMSPGSTLSDPGKVPSTYNRHGLVVGIKAWTQKDSTARDLARWATDSRLGICIRTNILKAIDIDVIDPVVSREMQEFIELGMGPLACRGRANSGKRLLVVRCLVAFPKRVIKTKWGNIELLSSGQQFVAVGTHPSGVRYDWGCPIAEIEIVEVTLAEIDVMWQALIDRYAIEDSVERAGMIPTKPRDVSDLTDPAVAWLDANGWVKGYERDGKVNVRCPWEGGHSTESNDTASTYFPAGVGGFAQGHFKCMHASCSKRTDQQFLIETGYATSEFEAAAVVGEAVANATGTGVVEVVDLPLPLLAREPKSGRPLAELNNVIAMLERPDKLGVKVGYDTFRCDLFIDEGKGKWRPIDDNDYTGLRRRLHAKGFKEIGSDMMKDAVRYVAAQNTFDSAIDWLRGLKWDGVRRVSTFFSRYFGVDETPYTRAVSNYLWTGLAGRCLVPGIKADMAPVLIGLQGLGKTSAIEAISPLEETFYEANFEKKDDDFARAQRGKLVGEIAELKGLGSRDSEHIKSVLTRRWEEWIPKYREHGTRLGRRSLFIGTGNREEFLEDETGHRRWLPMNSGKVDVAQIRADRDQLWAEGMGLFNDGGVAWELAETLAKAEHVAFTTTDIWQDEISAWIRRDDLDAPRAGRSLTMIEVLTSALRMDVKHATLAHEKRAGKALRALGYTKGVRRIGGVNAKVWVPPELDVTDIA